jgi:hypothetical protein
MTTELTLSQKEEMKRLKQYFPYRIVWACINSVTGEFSAQASSDKRAINKELRAGNQVFQLQ